MGFNVTDIMDRLVSHALTLGQFERVNGHEPKSPPGNGLTGAIWADQMGPAPGQSGLTSTTGRLVFHFRIYCPMILSPPDRIEPALLIAADAFMSTMTGDFELGNTVKCIDLHGMSGEALQGRAGYLDVGGKLNRVFTISIPVLVNDVWEQG